MHWRNLMDPGEFIGAWDLAKDYTLEIIDVAGQKLEARGDIKKSSRKPVLSFRGAKKKLICGATVCKTIAGLYGSDVRAWVGKKITLYATTTRATAGGTVECVRVRPTVPQEAAAASFEGQPVDEAMRDRQKRGAGELPAEREPGED